MRKRNTKRYEQNGERPRKQKKKRQAERDQQKVEWAADR